MGIDSDLIRGHIDTIILKILKDGDRYGYEICKEVEDKTNGAYELKQPTLYSCLKRLEDQKQISSYWQDSDIGGKRHYYKLTDVGLNTLNKNQEDWQKSRSIIDSLIYMSAPAPQEVSEPQKQIENEDALQIVDEPNPIQIENKDPLQIENEDPLQIVDEPNPLQIEDKDYNEESETSLIEDDLKNEIVVVDNDNEDENDNNDNNDNEDENVEKSSNSKSIKTAYDSFFDDDDEDDDEEIKDNKYNSEEEKQAIANIFGVEEHIQSVDTEESDDDDDEDEHDEKEDDDEESDDDDAKKDFVNDENVVQPDFLPTPPTIIDEVEKLTRENLELEKDETPVKPVEVEEVKLNKDESDFDVDKYLGKGSSYFNTGANQKVSLHNFMKNLKKSKDEKEEHSIMPESEFEESVEENAKRFGHYDSNESEVRYEEPESEFNHLIEPTTPPDNIKNVDFQNDEDKEFVDEIMLNFSEQKNDNDDDRFDSLNYVNNNEYETPTPFLRDEETNTNQRISEQMNSNVRFAQENADMISTKNKNDNNNVVQARTFEEEKQNQNNSLNLPEIGSANSINELKENMERIGIKVKPYSKTEKNVVVSRDYLLTNKIKFVRSFISCCFVIFLLCFSYIILDNYNVFEDTMRDTYIYYLLGILGSLLIPTIYGFIYLNNPFKKQPPKFAFRLSFLFSLLFFMQALVIIFATNIMLGFVSFAQIDYNHIQWIVPSTLSLWFLFQPIVHYYLFTSKKFFV